MEKLPKYGIAKHVSFNRDPFTDTHEGEEEEYDNIYMDFAVANRERFASTSASAPPNTAHGGSRLHVLARNASSALYSSSDSQSETINNNNISTNSTSQTNSNVYSRQSSLGSFDMTRYNSYSGLSSSTFLYSISSPSQRKSTLKLIKLGSSPPSPFGDRVYELTIPEGTVWFTPTEFELYKMLFYSLSNFYSTTAPGSNGKDIDYTCDYIEDSGSNGAVCTGDENQVLLIHGGVASTLFKRSGLSNQDLRAIWKLACGGSSKSKLSADEFFLACKMISLAQRYFLTMESSSTGDDNNNITNGTSSPITSYTPSLDPLVLHHYIPCSIDFNLVSLTPDTTVCKEPSADDSLCTVQVLNPTDEGFGLYKHTLYTVETNCAPDYFPQLKMKTKRRYSDIYWTHKRLILLHPTIGVPAIPPKQAFGNMSEEFVENRRADLENYLNYLARHPKFKKSFDLLILLNSTKQGFRMWKRIITGKLGGDGTVAQIIAEKRRGALQTINESAHADTNLSSFESNGSSSDAALHLPSSSSNNAHNLQLITKSISDERDPFNLAMIRNQKMKMNKGLAGVMLCIMGIPQISHFFHSDDAFIRDAENRNICLDKKEIRDIANTLQNFSERLEFASSTIQELLVTIKEECVEIEELALSILLMFPANTKPITYGQPLESTNPADSVSHAFIKLSKQRKSIIDKIKEFLLKPIQFLLNRIEGVERTLFHHRVEVDHWRVLKSEVESKRLRSTSDEEVLRLSQPLQSCETRVIQFRASVLAEMKRLNIERAEVYVKAMVKFIQCQVQSSQSEILLMKEVRSLESSASNNEIDGSNISEVKNIYSF